MNTFYTVVEKRGQPRIEFDDVDGLPCHVPAHWEVCTHCEGSGRSSDYLGAFTPADLEEAGPEFVEDYFSGMYDRPCSVCEGRRVVAVPMPEDLLDAHGRRALERWQARAMEEARFAMEEAAERRMGA